jgi:hypothetical protein
MTNPALTNLFNNVVGSNAPFFVARLYTITLFGGGVLRFTDADCDIVGVDEGLADLYLAGDLYQYPDLYAYGKSLIAGFTYSCSGARIDQASSKTQAHFKIGLDTDTWTLTVMPRPFDPVTGATFPDTIGSVPWLQAANNGALDAADFQVDEAYFAAVPTWPMPAGGAVPVACRVIFAGTIAEVDVTNSVAILTVNDYRSLLANSAPDNFFQNTCRFTLFGVGCNASGNMNAASFAHNGTCTSASTQSSITASGGLPAPSGSATYALGRIVFTSGLNNTFQRLIKSWDTISTVALFNPLPFPVSAGDTFTVYPGCNKLLTTCQAFQPATAMTNYGGQLNIPPPEILGGG